MDESPYFDRYAQRYHSTHLVLAQIPQHASSRRTLVFYAGTDGDMHGSTVHVGQFLDLRRQL